MIELNDQWAEAREKADARNFTIKKKEPEIPYCTIHRIAGKCALCHAAKLSKPNHEIARTRGDSESATLRSRVNGPRSDSRTDNLRIVSSWVNSLNLAPSLWKSSKAASVADRLAHAWGRRVWIRISFPKDPRNTWRTRRSGSNHWTKTSQKAEPSPLTTKTSANNSKRNSFAANWLGKVSVSCACHQV